MIPIIAQIILTLRKKGIRGKNDRLADGGQNHHPHLLRTHTTTCTCFLHNKPLGARPTDEPYPRSNGTHLPREVITLSPRQPPKPSPWLRITDSVVTRDNTR